MYALPYWVLHWLRQAAINARRTNRRSRYLAWSVAAGVANGLMISVGLTFVLVFRSVWWLALPMLALMVLPVVANPLIRFVLAPAGAQRVAYYAARISRPGTDPTAYALCAAAWASRDGTAIAWVEARRALRTPVGDAEIVTTGLLAAARGDAATARVLLRSVTMIVENHPAVRELAGEWLACDAAARGAWRELADDATGMRWPATPLTYLLEGIALHRSHAPAAPPARELWARWLLAPRHGVTRPLVVEALACEPGAPAARPSRDAMAGGAPLPHAVASHLAFEAEPATAASLELAVHAWDAALGDAGTRAWLAQRALELDAPLGAVDRAISDVAGAVTEDLARHAEAAQLGAPSSSGPLGPVGHGLTRRLRHGRLDALEAAFSRWADRRHDGSAHPAIDEWREFVALWTAYQAVVTAGGLELRRLAFPHAFSKGSHMAAWLWNKREEHALSHAISTWLLSEALAVGDAEAIELGHRNCALPVPTRLGRIES